MRFTALILATTLLCATARADECVALARAFAEDSSALENDALADLRDCVHDTLRKRKSASDERVVTQGKRNTSIGVAIDEPIEPVKSD